MDKLGSGFELDLGGSWLNEEKGVVRVRERSAVMAAQQRAWEAWPN